MSSVENWTRAYGEAPEVFDAFTHAEDPDGHVVACLRSHTGFAGRVVLEIGSGTGRYTRELWPGAAKYVALERSPAMLELARRRLAAACGPCLLCAAAESIPLRTHSVDQVIAAWVVGNLGPRVRETVLREIDRVLRPGQGGGAWLLENHWTGEFQTLRGRAGDAERARIEALTRGAGFRHMATIETELRFPSAAEAERILGYLCGESARQRLRESPVSNLTHNVVLLHRPPAS